MAPGRAGLNCKVCAGPAPFLESCDFNSHCERLTNPQLLAPGGIQVAYYRCSDCGFLFTPFMDGFSQADFIERVYNTDYRLVDPGFEEERPAALGAYLLAHFGDLPLSICDYGGGRGRTAQVINAAERKLRAATWDPFFDNAPMPSEKFDMVMSFEVFEHTPTPARTLAEMLALTDANRLVLLSTLCQPVDIATRRTGWWYCSPRNGHISMHTYESLDRLADAAGVGVTHLNPGTHLFHEVVPDWLLHFVTSHKAAPGGARP
jgi:2-polyprenyl-6-hydroxyphenyl methylase/3-demethylubiquinone-9 3-methyltransferase